jgi:hypothetical protein
MGKIYIVHWIYMFCKFAPLRGGLLRRGEAFIKLSPYKIHNV